MHIMVYIESWGESELSALRRVAARGDHRVDLAASEVAGVNPAVH